MQRIFIGASLRHIASVFKSDWRMFIAICWLPLMLMWLLKLGINNFAPDPKVLILHYRYKFEIIVNIHMALRIVLTSVMLVGIYRYLLNDPRVNLKAVQPKISAISRRIQSIPFYFTIDKSTLALAGLFIVGAGLFRLVDQILVIVFFDQTRSRLGQNLTLWIIWMQAPMQVWRFLYFAIATQLCLIFPYISTSRVITRQKIWQNIIALKGNRWQILAVLFIIGLCFALIWAIPFLVIYLIDQNNFLKMSMNWLRYATPVTSTLFGFISLVLSAIFYAESFKLLGSHDECLQKTPARGGALAGV